MEARKRNSRLEGGFASHFRDYIKYFQVRMIQKRSDEGHLNITDINKQREEDQGTLCSNCLPSGRCLNRIFEDIEGKGVTGLDCSYRGDQVECPNYDNTQILSLLSREPHYFEKTDKIFD